MNTGTVHGRLAIWRHTLHPHPWDLHASQRYVLPVFILLGITIKLRWLSSSQFASQKPFVTKTQSAEQTGRRYNGCDCKGRQQLQRQLYWTLNLMRQSAHAVLLARYPAQGPCRHQHSQATWDHSCRLPQPRSPLPSHSPNPLSQLYEGDPTCLPCPAAALPCQPRRPRQAGQRACHHFPQSSSPVSLLSCMWARPSEAAVSPMVCTNRQAT